MQISIQAWTSIASNFYMDVITRLCSHAHVVLTDINDFKGLQTPCEDSNYTKTKPVPPWCKYLICIFNNNFTKIYIVWNTNDLSNWNKGMALNFCAYLKCPLRKKIFVFYDNKSYWKCNDHFSLPNALFKTHPTWSGQGVNKPNVDKPNLRKGAFVRAGIRCMVMAWCKNVGNWL